MKSIGHEKAQRTQKRSTGKEDRLFASSAPLRGQLPRSSGARRQRYYFRISYRLAWSSVQKTAGFSGCSELSVTELISGLSRIA